MEDRIQRAVELFRQGYNCSQSVCAAFADEYGYTFEQALRMSASFGGGIGRMRMTCGAACGMFILAGLETGCVEGKDREGKEANYRLVQQQIFSIHLYSFFLIPFQSESYSFLLKVCCKHIHDLL